MLASEPVPFSALAFIRNCWESHRWPSSAGGLRNVGRGKKKTKKFCCMQWISLEWIDKKIYFHLCIHGKFQSNRSRCAIIKNLEIWTWIKFVQKREPLKYICLKQKQNYFRRYIFVPPTMVQNRGSWGRQWLWGRWRLWRRLWWLWRRFFPLHSFRPLQNFDHDSWVYRISRNSIFGSDMPSALGLVHIALTDIISSWWFHTISSCLSEWV